VAIVSGSGPTVIGLFCGSGGAQAASEATRRLAGRDPPALAATPVGPEAGAPTLQAGAPAPEAGAPAPEAGAPAPEAGAPAVEPVRDNSQRTS
jgi:hypothetical protein